MRYTSVIGLYASILFLFSLMFIASCDGCNEDLTKELNNGNDDPEVLIFRADAEELMSTDIWKRAFPLSSIPTGGCAPADLDEDLLVNMNIEVRTASFVDGVLDIDPTPFFSANSQEPGFFGPDGVIRDNDRWDEDEGQVILPRGRLSDPDARFHIMVPETGGYELRIEFEFENCSACCHGDNNDFDCNTTERRGNFPHQECAAGRLTLTYEKIYSEMLQSRPRPDVDHILDSMRYFPRPCRRCNCWEPCVL